MKTILFAVAILVSLLVPAYADVLPKEYLGSWCQKGMDEHVRINAECPEIDVEFKRGSYVSHEQKCKFMSIRKEVKGIITVARCYSESNNPKSWIQTLKLFYDGRALWSRVE